MGPPRLLPLLRRLRRAASATATTTSTSSRRTSPLGASNHSSYSTYNSGPWIPTSFAAAASSSSSSSSPSSSLAAANPYARRRNPFLQDAERRARRRASAWALAVGSGFALATGAILAAAPHEDEDDEDEQGADGEPAPATPEEAAARAEAAAAAAAAAGAANAASSNSDGVVASGRKLLPLHLRRRIFFKYEKRIREMSTLEKVFDYFASVVAPEAATVGSGPVAALAAAAAAGGATSGGADALKLQQQQQQQQQQPQTTLARHMTARDLVRAVVPTYPPLHSDVERAGRLPGEPGAGAAGGGGGGWRKRLSSSFQASSPSSPAAGHGIDDCVFKRFDVNGDGLISYAEFVLLVNLLAIPEDEVRAVFGVVDVDGSGSIDAAEFAAVMRMIERRAGVRASFLPRPGKHAPSSNVAAEDAALLRHFFGADGQGTLDLRQWSQFITELHADVRRLEFAHYDVNGDGECSAEDFATSLVTAADVRGVDALLDRAEALPQELKRVRVTARDFEAVAKARAARRQLGVALSFCRSMERDVTGAELRRLLTRISGAEFRPEIVAIMMHVFAAPAAAAAATSSGSGGAGGGGGAAAAGAAGAGAALAGDAASSVAAAPAAAPEPTLDVGLFLDVMRRRSRVPGQQYDSHHHHGGGGKKGGGGNGGGGGGGGKPAISSMDGDDDEEEEDDGPLATAWRRIVRTITRGGGGDDDD